MSTVIQPRVDLPRRVAAAREKAGISQVKLSQLLGFKNRQSLEQIESGVRKVTPDELLTIIETTQCDLDYFTDPFRLVGEGAFSYRASGTKNSDLDRCEDIAGRWLALWRHLGTVRGEKPRALRPKLPLSTNSRFEDAQALGEALAQELKLGTVPAEKLEEAMVEQLELVVLHVDLPSGVSGAAIQLPMCDTILINRDEPPGRRAFDLAHELFHVLTWDAMPPDRVDRQAPRGYKGKRTEQLADNFAGSLLMPEGALRPLWNKKPKTSSLANWIQALAEHFKVSAAAVYWRLAALHCLDSETTPKPVSGIGQDPVKKRPLFSRPFMERMVWGVEHGEISVNRLLKILDLSLETFRETCAAHGVEVDIGL